MSFATAAPGNKRRIGERHGLTAHAVPEYHHFFFQRHPIIWRVIVFNGLLLALIWTQARWYMRSCRCQRRESMLAVTLWVSSA